MSKYNCETCRDEMFFGYYGEIVLCADCCDDLTSYEAVEKRIGLLKEENDKLRFMVQKGLSWDEMSVSYESRLEKATKENETLCQLLVKDDMLSYL